MIVTIKKNKTFIITFYALALCSLIVASFADLQIDIALNNPNNIIANWFWRTGEMPGALVCPLAGWIIFSYGEKTLNKLIGLAIELGGSIYLGCYIADYFFIKDSFQTVFGAVFGIGIGVCLLFAGRFVNLPKNLKKPLVTIAVAGIVCMFLKTAVTEITKILWGRERMRMLIAEGSYDNFTQWYQPQGITDSNEYKSFPSGHTSGAAMSYLAMLFSYAGGKFERYNKLYFAIPFVYTSIVAFTRLVMGAHFLSDVTVGGIIGFTTVVIAMAVIDKLDSKKNHSCLG